NTNKGFQIWLVSPSILSAPYMELSQMTGKAEAYLRAFQSGLEGFFPVRGFLMETLYSDKHCLKRMRKQAVNQASPSTFANDVRMSARSTSEKVMFCLSVGFKVLIRALFKSATDLPKALLTALLRTFPGQNMTMTAPKTLMPCKMGPAKEVERSSAGRNRARVGRRRVEDGTWASILAMPWRGGPGGTRCRRCGGDDLVLKQSGTREGRWRFQERPEIQVQTSEAMEIRSREYEAKGKQEKDSFEHPQGSI
ncbi:hypothetical protein IE53DRAFT_364961, partial [Violaceomyces palustris]